MRNMTPEEQRREREYELKKYSIVDIEQLEKENIELKSKLENMPTLNRQSVEKIFKKGLKFLPNKPIYHYFSEKAIDKKIDAICQLAIKEEDIIDVREKYRKEIDKYDNDNW